MKKAFITSLEEKVNPRHSAILVVDVQNIFCHKKSAVAKKGIDLSMPQKVIPNISSFIDRAREKSVKIIFIQQDINAFSDSQVSKEMMYRVGWKGIKHGKELKWSEELCIKPEAQDLVLRKKKYSAFFGTRLDSILKSKIDSLTNLFSSLSEELTANQSELAEINKRSFVKKYGKENGQRVASGRIWKGMTTDMLKDIWGKPDKITSNKYSYGVYTQWYYGDITYFFKNSVLIDWEQGTEKKN